MCKLHNSVTGNGQQAEYAEMCDLAFKKLRLDSEQGESNKLLTLAHECAPKRRCPGG